MQVVARVIRRSQARGTLRVTQCAVEVDEAIELARAYSGDEAARFVNGVLDGVFTRLKDEGKVVD